MTVVSMNYLLEAGVQFGHQKRRWIPKMKEYIFESRDDINIFYLTERWSDGTLTNFKTIISSVKRLEEL